MVLSNPPIQSMCSFSGSFSHLQSENSRVLSLTFVSGLKIVYFNGLSISCQF
jgi:hypothetical protein